MASQLGPASFAVGGLRVQHHATFLPSIRLCICRWRARAPAGCALLPSRRGATTRSASRARAACAPGASTTQGSSAGPRATRPACAAAHWACRQLGTCCAWAASGRKEAVGSSGHMRN